MSQFVCSLATVEDCGGTQPGCLGECQGHSSLICERPAPYRLESDLALQYTCAEHLPLMLQAFPDANLTGVLA